MRFLFSVVAILAGMSVATCAQSSASSTAPLRVVIIGLVHGHISGFLDHYRNSPELQIAGIYEPDQPLAQQYADRYHFSRDILFTDLDALLSKTNPQAALVYTSTFEHRAAAEACARHHVPVMMEKPLAVSYDDALAIQRAATAANIPVIVNYETTWYPANQIVQGLVKDGSIGAIRKVVVHDGHRGPKEIGVQPEFLAWLTDPKLNGAGALFDFGCYGADLMTWLMNGGRPATVTAATQQIKPEVYPKVDDEATIILTYPQAQAIIQASWNWPFDRKDMEVYGAKGYVITTGRDQARVRLPGATEKLETAARVPLPDDDQIDYLRAVVLGGMKPTGLGSLPVNVTVMEILDAARRSAETGKTVSLTSSR